ncbi:MAG: Gfo/Idh/MocA family oxidoreductase [Armatimonadota bacterium]|nr:Gfo/Idh/MocA family oxidoreductase [Armatimonadota bacterium]MCX7777799.1 Gfo/Idh/MocA family oxidoreductase [Armatimonadota bacterium]MDW8025913.1 Gfo/Idh/MocA family oxidoreductase [Armatimonadota bacterium]
MPYIGRREFVVGGATVFTLASLAKTEIGALEKEKERKETILCGVIGTGSHGRVLLKELMRMDGVEIVALCDIYQPNLERSLKGIGREVRSYSDHRQMLEREKDMQAVIIATPTGTHVPISIDSLQAGKHVYCEAPLANDIEDCKRMVKAAEASGKVFQVGYQRRFSPLYKHALKFIRVGALGQPVQARAHYNRKDSMRRPVPDTKYERLLNWRLYRDTSGGLAVEFGSHQLDVVNWFLGATPISVVGNGGIDVWKDGREVCDNIHLLFEYPNGVKVTYTATLGCSYERNYELFLGTMGAMWFSKEQIGLWFKEPDAPELGWEIYARKEQLGDSLGIVLDPEASKYVAQLESGFKPPEKQKPEFKNPFYIALNEFFECIREGKKPACGAKEALQSTVTAIVANMAIEKGERITYRREWFEV